MEVHKHSQNLMHKKHWFEYLLEFFMLFLAVFLGFVTENIREKAFEKKNERAYIKLFIEDLQTDTAILHNVIPKTRQTVRGLDTLIDQVYLYLQGKADSRLMYYTYHYYCRNPINIQLSKRALTQMRSAGAMKLIHDKQAAELIAGGDIGFDQFEEQTRFIKERQEEPAQFGFKIFDFREYQKANIDPNGTTNQNDDGFLKLSYQPPLNTSDPAYLKEFAARVGYFRNSLNGYVITMGEAIPGLESAIAYLKKHYNY